jgi:hypothetical protein
MNNNCDFINGNERISLGTWIWSTDVFDNAIETFSFLKKNNVNEIYLAYNNTIPFEEYGKFIEVATKNKMKVLLIGCHAYWILPYGYEDRDKYFKWFEDYQTQANENQKLYGFHMDVEPYQLKEWSDDLAGTIKAYMEFVIYASKISKKNHVLLELDIPHWFDKLVVKSEGESIPLCEFCIRNADTTLIMSYRDNARDVFNTGKFELELSRKYKKKVVLAVETGGVYEEINITFHHMGTIPLYDQLRELRKIVEAESKPFEAGYAIHHYHSWVKLPPTGNPLDDNFPYNNPNYSHLIKG